MKKHLKFFCQLTDKLDMKITDNHLKFYGERKLRRSPTTVSIHSLIPQERRSKGDHQAHNLMIFLRRDRSLCHLRETLARFAHDNPRTPCPRRAAFARKWLARLPELS